MRGPKKPPSNKKDRVRIDQLERELRRLTKRAERAEALVELQKKVAALLGNPLTDEDER
jgi:hypothetical protein